MIGKLSIILQIIFNDYSIICHLHMGYLESECPLTNFKQILNKG